MAEITQRLLPLLPVTPDVDRPSTFQARFLDRAWRCAGAFGLGEVGFECCQAGWRAGIRPRLRRIGGRAVAGARPAGISRVVRRCRGSRRVGGVPVDELSGGERQGVTIARAMYFKTKIMILDEPTNHLSNKETRLVRDPGATSPGSYATDRDTILKSAFNWKAIKANQSAWLFFANLAPSYKRDSIWWVMRAKKEETRLRRLGILIASSEAGLEIPTLRKK